MKKRVADIVIETLVENNITDCFAVVGGGAMHLDNALAINQNINKYFNHHEQACAMAAEGYAKYSGRMAAVCVTSGPGALNTLNGVQGAYVDNTPMIVIAGHPRLNTTVGVTGLDLRSRGVQEFDIVPAVKGMTKYASMLTDPLAVKKELQKAIDIAMQGRCGPVWLSIPLDIQGMMIEEEELLPIEKIADLSFTLEDSVFDKINDLIQNAKRPVILSGSGLRCGNAVEQFREWVKRMNIPVVSGALLPDIMSEDTKNFYGTSGNVGQRKGNFILQNADLIIAIGNSLSTKQTGFNQEAFAPNAKIVMIDAGKDETKKPGLHIDVAVYSDAKMFIQKANDKISPWKQNKRWIEYCDELKKRLGNIDDYVKNDSDTRIPQLFMWDIIRNKLKDEGIVALGNSSGLGGGILQKSVKKPNQRVIVNYNSGSMGDDLPEAIGVAVASGKQVLCATGDGSIMMNIQELQTIVHYNFDIKIIILSNDGYAAIRQTNKNFFDGKYIGCDSTSGVSMPDFSKVIEGFGIKFFRAESVSSFEKTYDEFMATQGPAVLEVYQKIDDPVVPKVMSKMDENGVFVTPPLHDMYPFISEKLMKELMLISEEK